MVLNHINVIQTEKRKPNKCLAIYTNLFSMHYSNLKQYSSLPVSSLLCNIFNCLKVSSSLLIYIFWGNFFFTHLINLDKKFKKHIISNNVCVFVFFFGDYFSRLSMNRKHIYIKTSYPNRI